MAVPADRGLASRSWTEAHSAALPLVFEVCGCVDKQRQLCLALPAECEAGWDWWRMMGEAVCVVCNGTVRGFCQAIALSTCVGADSNLEICL